MNVKQQLRERRRTKDSTDFEMRLRLIKTTRTFGRDMKTIITKLIVFTSIAASVSCAFDPAYANKTAQSKSDAELLKSFGDVSFMPNLSGARRNNYAATENEILSRGLVRRSKMQLIRERKVEIGMTKNEVTLSWGRPSDINKTIGSGYYSEQWVYGGYSSAGSGSFSPMGFVYFNDSGRVTTIQN